MNEIVSLKDIVVDFDGERILDELSLDIHDKEFVTFLGPSGCGKTTTLRCLAGFVEPNGGDIVFEGKVINDIPPHKRKVNTIFQRYALFSHMNVFENVELPLTYLGIKASERKERVLEILKRMNLSHRAKHFPQQLSGGQQQRVAIARALVSKPAIVLADEPTGNLDSRTSADVLGLLQRTSREFNQTLVMITHNDAIAQLADRIVRIEDGKIVG